MQSMAKWAVVCLFEHTDQQQQNMRAIEITSDLDDIEEVDEDLFTDCSSEANFDGLRRRKWRSLFKTVYNVVGTLE